ncbi:unnamed protein product [Lampetra fluviatilis]
MTGAPACMCRRPLRRSDTWASGGPLRAGRDHNGASLTRCKRRPEEACTGGDADRHPVRPACSAQPKTTDVPRGHLTPRVHTVGPSRMRAPSMFGSSGTALPGRAGSGLTAPTGAPWEVEARHHLDGRQALFCGAWYGDANGIGTRK